MADEQGPDEVPDDLDDLGEPIEALRTFEVEPSEGFVPRLLDALRRKNLGSQLATLSWTGVGVVLFEFIQMIFSLFDYHPKDDGGSS